MSTAVVNLEVRPTYRASLVWAMIPLVLVACVGPTLAPFAATWLAAVALYAMFKIWTLQEFARSNPVPWPAALAYLFLWPGMDPSAFVRRDAKIEKPAFGDWLWAAGKIAFGAILVWTIVGRLVSTHELLAGWIGLVGLAFLLHFGFIHWLALVWRSVGVPVEPIMRLPILAKSVSDFWSHRWNLAFRDLAQVFFFRPFFGAVGIAGATMIVFAMSGLIHDLIISLPSRGGYGWPSMYFIVQGMAVLLEKSRLGRRIGLGRGIRGRVFAWLIVAPGAFWLFHPPFIHEVVLPTLAALGAY